MINNNQKLIELLITNSTKEGDLILDSFCDTCATPVICKELNRNYIGYELNQKFADVVNNRLNNI